MYCIWPSNVYSLILHSIFYVYRVSPGTIYLMRPHPYQFQKEPAKAKLKSATIWAFTIPTGTRGASTVKCPKCISLQYMNPNPPSSIKFYIKTVENAFFFSTKDGSLTIFEFPADCVDSVGYQCKSVRVRVSHTSETNPSEMAFLCRAVFAENILKGAPKVSRIPSTRSRA